MPKKSSQKLKLLYLMRILLQNTDETHPMTTAELIDALDRCGVPAERKSVYDDLESLRLFGLDVVQTKSKTTGYYIGARDFELPELKLLVDSVQSSKFITYKKTLALIKKIESMTSVHEAQLLQRQVYVRNRVKSMNESVYYNVDEVSNAIARDRVIRFFYFEYTPQKERRLRHDGARYEVSPFALMWDDENYYMMAWDDAAGLMKHYRVDKMSEIELAEMPRAGKDAFAQVEMSSYAKKVFGMFTGTEQTVRLRFADHLAGAVIDRFGKDVYMAPGADGHFITEVTVDVSPQFLAWVFGFGTNVEVLSPDNVRCQMRDAACGVAALYAPVPAAAENREGTAAEA